VRCRGSAPSNLRAARPYATGAARPSLAPARAPSRRFGRGLFPTFLRPARQLSDQPHVQTAARAGISHRMADVHADVKQTTRSACAPWPPAAVRARQSLLSLAAKFSVKRKCVPCCTKLPTQTGALASPQPYLHTGDRAAPAHPCRASRPQARRWAAGRPGRRRARHCRAPAASPFSRHPPACPAVPATAAASSSVAATRLLFIRSLFQCIGGRPVGIACVCQ
jgi:hypothetical protein